MSDARVYLSFDVAHDADLGSELVAQSERGGSGFEVSGQSEPGEATERWTDAARRRIRDADQMIMICGEHTEGSIHQNAELRIAEEEGKPYFLVWGRRDRMCTMPARVSRSACMYSWTWDILVRQVSDTLRNAQPLQVPDDCKRP